MSRGQLHWEIATIFLLRVSKIAQLLVNGYNLLQKPFLFVVWYQYYLSKFAVFHLSFIQTVGSPFTKFMDLLIVSCDTFRDFVDCCCF